MFVVSDIAAAPSCRDKRRMTAGGDSAVYDDLMRFKPDGLTPNAWAMKAGVSRTVWADMRRHGNPSRRTLDKLLTAANSSLAEFEALRIGGVARDGAEAMRLADRGASPWGAAQLPPLPLIATAMAGDWGDPAARSNKPSFVRASSSIGSRGRSASQWTRAPTPSPLSEIPCGRASGPADGSRCHRNHRSRSATTWW